ncbi:UbiA family prenyltransferase [Methanoculleus chikugoensis]|uniref:UbiA family prenyltransferase n=1 Tax=Methanoculleus chikugoensis TaxID=118126 RepID=UPI001FB550A2|nr:UbiA family prenyltransferase [Methanoculleus chikugoensis]
MTEIMRETLVALADLTRAHFFFVWPPLLFCSGAGARVCELRGVLVGTRRPGGADRALRLYGRARPERLHRPGVRQKRRRRLAHPLLAAVRRAADPDRKTLPPRAAFAVFLLLAGFAAALAATLPAPHNLYVLGIMGYSYAVEYFYQTKKRNQKIPLAQVIGRTDFALFPVAGYLVYGNPDATALLFFLFFYPWTLAHLGGANDIADIVNDRARGGMATIPALYGMKARSPGFSASRPSTRVWRSSSASRSGR